MDWGFQGKTVLVTGAAVGIGAEIARHFRDSGARVFGADRAWPEGTGMIESITPITLDVTDRDGVHSAVEEILAVTGGLDVLVNNAGTMRARDSIFEYDANDWQTILDVNASGLFFCTQAAARAMTDKGAGGAIVNIASTAGRTGKTMSPPYAASKAAVINITRSSALMLAAASIRVNAVAPGIIDTEFNYRLGVQFGPRDGLSPEEFVARRAEVVPLGRIGTASDVARAVCFLASPLADYITGQTLNIDGGIVSN
jgi:NAD(P)-dependent dehydrogenase (short-subunit alcohol dehydrogenase family)